VITCGNCKKGHETVQEVKNCYGRSSIAHRAAFAATAPQLKYIATLLAERDMTPLPKDARLSKTEASALITELKQTPRPADPGRQSADGDPEGYGDTDPDVVFSDGEDFEIRQAQYTRTDGMPFRVWEGGPMPIDHPHSAFRTSPQAAAWTMPEGYYAIPSLTGNNDLDFYRVDRPDTGRWAGYTFVKMVIGGKSAMSVRGRDRLFQILSAIEKDPAKAAWQYGQSIGNCDKCNTHLTDAASRSYSRGPNCRAKYGLGFRGTEVSPVVRNSTRPAGLPVPSRPRSRAS